MNMNILTSTDFFETMSSFWHEHNTSFLTSALTLLIINYSTLLVVYLLVRQLRRGPPKVKANSHSHFQATLKASDHANDGKYHLLLAATGSVATIKIPLIISALSDYNNLSIRLLLSSSAAEFLQNQAAEQPSLVQIAQLKNVDGIYYDADEWRKPWVRGDSILHIELRRWADLMVIAPLSANSLAKLALGMSENLVSSVARAWDTTGLIDGLREGVELVSTTGNAGDGVPRVERKAIMVAPAMNTAMWNHPATKRHLDVLTKEWGVEGGGWFEVLWPIDKGLACGDKGGGAMKEWKEIVGEIEAKFPGLRTTHGETATNGKMK